MKIYPRTYKFEAEQKCSEYDRDNLADVEVVLYDKCEYLQDMGNANTTSQIDN